MTDRKYPIGLFELQDDYSDEELNNFIHILKTIPAEYNKLTHNLTDEELTKTYREGSWNIRQLVHHVADIQFLQYFRMKKALTEPDYKEMTIIDMNAWSATSDALNAPISHSLNILEGILSRHAFFAKTLTPEQLSITYFHPARGIWMDQKQAIAMAVWHVKHHLAHIELALG